jgi:hypothetical protein
LKGSTTNRKSVNKKKNNILKDVNFLEIQRENDKKLINIDNFVKESIQKIIKIDSKFLRDNNILDYSLLLTIENLTESQTEIFLQKRNEL